jgi:hypothetical protein
MEENSGIIKNVTSLEIRLENQLSSFCLRSGNYTGICISRSVPEGVKQWEFEYPFTEFKVRRIQKGTCKKYLYFIVKNELFRYCDTQALSFRICGQQAFCILFDHESLMISWSCDQDP